MRAELTPRLMAVALAVAAVADPAVRRERTVPSPIALVVLDDPRLPAEAWTSVERLRSSLADDFDVAVRVHSQSSAAAACPADGGCILVSSGSTPARLTAGAEVIGAVHARADGDRVTTIGGVRIPRTVSVSAVASIEVQLRRRGANPTEVRVFDEAALVGTARVEAVQETTLAVRVEWIPIASGARQLRVVVGAADGPIDDEVDIGVNVRADQSAILMHEPEATWLGTFVRRALTVDPRFRVDARTRLAPSLTIGANRGGALTAEALAGASVLIVTAPELLSATEISLLDRFARARGGSVVLLPDRRPTGPVLQLMPPIRGERRESEPHDVGSIRATELLEFDGSHEGVAVLERADGHPVMVAMAVGRGRVITSGALDAWRFRGEGITFERFWSGLVAAAADAAGPPLHVGVSDALIARGGDTELSVEWRTLDDIGERVIAQAEARCPDAAPAPIRLWPTGRRGAFTGRVRGATLGSCTIQAEITDPVHIAGTTSLFVAERPRLSRGPQALETAIAAQAGLVVEGGDEGTLVARTRDRQSSQREPRETRPMRSPWWVAPFAGFLGVEWWLRRRRGLA